MRDAPNAFTWVVRVGVVCMRTSSAGDVAFI